MAKGSSYKKPYIEELFDSYHATKDRNILKLIASSLIDGARADQFAHEHPKEYEKYIKKMQNMRIIGKDKGDRFTRAEIERTQMSIVNKNLTIIGDKPGGSSTGGKLTQPPRADGKSPTSYIVKKAEPFEHLYEVVGGRFYSEYSGELGSITAKTRFAGSQNGTIRTASRILSYYHNYQHNHTPVIHRNKLVLRDSKTIEVKGYISMLVVARFIGDYDAIGYGSNAGFMVGLSGRENANSNAKIDPGYSFSFMPEEHDNTADGYISYSSMGIATHVAAVLLGAKANYKGKFFHTCLPLDFIDPTNKNLLRPELGIIRDSLLYLYPGLDNRDLLLGEMSYAEISQSPKLYKQMAKTIAAIVNSSDSDLYDLINYNTPDVINGKNIQPEKSQLFEQLKIRRNLMGHIYAQEVEYMRLYNEAKASKQKINFPALKAQAAANIFEIPFLSDSETIVITSALREDFKYCSDQIISKLNKGKISKSGEHKDFIQKIRGNTTSIGSSSAAAPAVMVDAEEEFTTLTPINSLDIDIDSVEPKIADAFTRACCAPWSREKVDNSIRLLPEFSNEKFIDSVQQISDLIDAASFYRYAHAGDIISNIPIEVFDLYVPAIIGAIKSSDDFNDYGDIFASIPNEKFAQFIEPICQIIKENQEIKPDIMRALRGKGHVYEIMAKDALKTDLSQNTSITDENDNRKRKLDDEDSDNKDSFTKKYARKPSPTSDLER